MRIGGRSFQPGSTLAAPAEAELGFYGGEVWVNTILVGGLEHKSYCSIYIGNNHPN